jgi:NADPH-ferrihemoprotein reductase
MKQMLIGKQNKEVVVFFGSQSGKSERYANLLARECHAAYGIAAMVADPDDYDHKHLVDFPANKIMVFIMATYGEGDPTDNANTFNEYLMGLRHKSNTVLSNLNYFAFGLGNSNYRLFNRFIDLVDDKLQAKGAQRLGYIGKADEAKGATATEEAFREWKADMLEKLAQRLNRKERVLAYESGLEIIEASDRNPESSPDIYLGEPNFQHLSGSPDSHIDLRNPYAAPIAESRELFISGDRNCIHMEFDISGVPSVKYRCGDHLAVWPVNPNNEVERLVSVLGWDDRTRHAVIDIKPRDKEMKVPIPSPTTRETILRYYLEICGPISRDLVGLLNDFCPSDTARSYLGQLYKDWSIIGNSFSNKHLNIGKLLLLADANNRWTSVPVTLLIEAIPKLQPRYYSIASSPTVSPRRPAITAVVAGRSLPSFTETDGRKRFHGVATHYLLAHDRHHNGSQSRENLPTYDLNGPRGKLAPSKILIHIRTSTFKLPTNPSRPIIMIAAGTGIAPFRGFVQERAKLIASGKDIGKMLLFFGCRSPDEDFLYADEWDHYAQVAPLQVVTAFSRYHKEKKAYVQDRLEDHAATVLKMIVNEGAYLYICGTATMAQEVRMCLVKILAAGMGCSVEEAESWVARKLKAVRRLQEDVWNA